MNKKSMLKVLCALLTVTLLLAGCSGSANPPAATQGSTTAAATTAATAAATTAAPASKAPIYMRMGTGGTGGVFYTFGVGIGTLVSNKTNMQFTVESTKASVENMRLLNSKDIEVGFASFPTSMKSYKGNAPFDKAIEVNVLLQPYTNPVHLIVMADSPYKKLEDLKGKKISIGQPGSGNAEVATTFLEGLYGWVDGKDYSGQYLTYTESVEAFKNGQIDAAIFDTGFPTASVIDLSSWKPIRLLGVDTALVEKATNEYGKQFITTTIPGGTYRGQDTDTLTIGHGNYIMCRADWDEEYAYTFVKTIFENMDFVKNIHAVAKDLTPELAANGGGVPLHPGAIRYYKEVGAIK